MRRRQPPGRPEALHPRHQFPQRRRQRMVCCQLHQRRGQFRGRRRRQEGHKHRLHHVSGLSVTCSLSAVPMIGTCVKLPALGTCVKLPALNYGLQVTLHYTSAGCKTALLAPHAGGAKEIATLTMIASKA
eukprot:gnl/TRDRNA2_/TRDRNA2_138224_c0_seq2.p2 gnl/TRDRNA2_/TRDRNA2_138224_c0~~gnl/TRDRNA2_/TRDRNA2_138224_c0_seq2.p2  ORF type:complete len:130 (-),score=4.14 gnl/TRDRNA2_/TRDRNA2_138224_c0_seq2:192-581(-)